MKEVFLAYMATLKMIVYSFGGGPRYLKSRLMSSFYINTIIRGE